MPSRGAPRLADAKVVRGRTRLDASQPKRGHAHADREVLGQIQSLVDEEHALLEIGPKHELSPAQHDRLKAIEVSLDQCWDLLRQRRARREFGENPDDERYKQ